MFIRFYLKGMVGKVQFCTLLYCKSRRADFFSVRWFEESRRTKFNAKSSNQTEDDLNVVY